MTIAETLSETLSKADLLGAAQALATRRVPIADPYFLAATFS